MSSQITKEYPVPAIPTPTRRAPAQVIEEPEIDIAWEKPEVHEISAVEQALADLAEPVSMGLAAGSGPAPVDGAPLIQPDRKRAQSRPSMKSVLSGEIDTEAELDVPTFIRRHSATQQ